MALTDARKCTLHIKQWPRRYEQVEQGSCADPGIFVRRGGGGGGSRPDGQITVQIELWPDLTGSCGS